MRNVELKACLQDWDSAVAACERVGARLEGDIRQVDTFFRVPEGRLKLRTSEPGESCLIFYHRPDVAGVKGCDYLIEPVRPSMGVLLDACFGTLGEVRKVRTLWLWENVRIHLDRVVGLGEFIEFEAVLSGTHDDADGHAKLARLREVFQIGDSDLLTASYFDMLAERAGPK
ncbi:MAG: class IV adenylate cyclase [Candidatus Hydrogenedentes bacterium]|nr:class IV adenylate cyclase [Candidatus Hydrogenedentota bacterium]